MSDYIFIEMPEQVHINSIGLYIYKRKSSDSVQLRVQHVTSNKSLGSVNFGSLDDAHSWVDSVARDSDFDAYDSASRTMAVIEHMGLGSY
jgi:hypothetical protein